MPMCVMTRELELIANGFIHKEDYDEKVIQSMAAELLRLREIQEIKSLPNKTWQTEEPDIKSFLLELWMVCEKYGLALSHEDGQGAFEVRLIKKYYHDWLMEAIDRTSK